jgi:hypothetical protein
MNYLPKIRLSPFDLWMIKNLILFINLFCNISWLRCARNISIFFPLMVALSKSMNSVPDENTLSEQHLFADIPRLLYQPLKMHVGPPQKRSHGYFGVKWLLDHSDSPALIMRLRNP